MVFWRKKKDVTEKATPDAESPTVEAPVMPEPEPVMEEPVLPAEVPPSPAAADQEPFGEAAAADYRLRHAGGGADLCALDRAHDIRASGRLVRPGLVSLAVVTEHDRSSPLAPGLPLSVLAERLGLPSPELARAVVRPPLRVESGRVTSGRTAVLPE